MSGLRIAVVGGGMGGLCLAQGLRRSGLDVTVYESDPSLQVRRQGYRLHLDARAGLALERCLPPDLFDLFLATCSLPSRRFTVLDSRLRVLQESPIDPGQDPYTALTLATSANRQTLREVLAAGLGERFVLDARLGRFEDDGDVIRLHFEDGTETDVDVLVGADGVGSVVRRQHLPQAEVSDTGSRVIYGKTPLTDTALPLLPSALRDGFTAVVGGRVGLATGLVRFRERPEAAAARVSGVSLSPADDYLMWAVATDREGFGVDDTDLAGRDASRLHELALSTTATWHPDLRSLLRMADVEQTFLVRVRASTPPPAWPASRVTLVGDAIHAMSPARGSGANTALQDAGVLCAMLTDPDLMGPGGPTAAIARYEEQMRDYAYAAVEASRQAEAQFGAAPRGLAGWIFRHLPHGRASAG